MIIVKDLTVRLGDFALEKVSFQVEEGAFHIILGPTGAGKSVVVETIGGVITPDSGQVLMDGRDITREKPENRQMAICYQDYALFPHLTVRENILYGVRYKGRKRDLKMLERLVELLGIEHLLMRYPDTLSGGEKQRVSLARGLMVRPKVLLLDEPLAALDAHIKEGLMRDIKRLHQELHMTVLMVTHSFREAYYLGDGACVIHNGRIVQTGTLEAIMHQPNSPFVANFVGLRNVWEGQKLGKPESPYVGIRPEHVAFGKTPVTADIAGKCRVTEVADMGTHFEVSVDADEQILIGYMMFDDFMQERLEEGDDAFYGIDKKHLVALSGYTE